MASIVYGLRLLLRLIVIPTNALPAGGRFWLFAASLILPAAAAEVVRVWMVALRRSLIVARSVSSETKAKEIHAATGTKVNDRWATFFTDGVVSSCLPKCYIATTILQSLQDFEVPLNTSSSSVVPKLRSYFVIEGESLKLLVKNLMQQPFL